VYLPVFYAFPARPCRDRTPKITTAGKFQAVLLANGQVHSRRREKTCPVSNDARFPQRQTKWRAPTFMSLNNRHSVANGPPAKNSKVARRIARAATEVM
jgi:hypothetical protein